MSDDSWDTIQTELDAHFLQTRPWAAFQTALGRQVFTAHGEGWSWLAILEHGKLGSRLYCPYGPTVTKKSHLTAALAALKICAQEQQIDFIRIEPCGPITAEDCKKSGLKRAVKEVQPSLTWVKDLTKSEDELLAEMTATNRNLHRTADRKGLSFRFSNDPRDIRIFLDMIHEVATRTGIQPHSDHYYTKMVEVLLPMDAAKLYIAEAHGKPVAASIIFDSSSTRYYAHAGSRFDARKLHPGPPLLSHMIFEAKQAGKQTFDFFGIAPADQPNHPWAGFTKFKQSFGGHELERVGTWELPIKPLKYGLYSVLLHLHR